MLEPGRGLALIEVSILLLLERLRLFMMLALKLSQASSQLQPNVHTLASRCGARQRPPPRVGTGASHPTAHPSCGLALRLGA